MSSSYPAGSQGGEAKHTLKKRELPQFAGSINMRANTQDSNSVDIITNIGANMALRQNDTVWDGILVANTGNASNSQKKNWQLSFDNGGKGKAHNNMPPYLAVYIWKRTA